MASEIGYPQPRLGREYGVVYRGDGIPAISSTSPRKSWAPYTIFRGPIHIEKSIRYAMRFLDVARGYYPVLNEDVRMGRGSFLPMRQLFSQPNDPANARRGVHVEIEKRPIALSFKILTKETIYFAYRAEDASPNTRYGQFRG